MNIDNKEFLRILEKYRNGQASAEEEDFLHAYYNMFDLKEDPLKSLGESEKNELKKSIRAELKARIDTGTEGTTRKDRFYMRWSAAAAVLILVSSGIWFWVNQTEESAKSPVQSVTIHKQDIAPGTNKAILTLGDGSTIMLDDAVNGVLAKEGGAAINKTKDGEIVYEAGAGQAKRVVTYNMVATPRGGQYQLTLPDGSKVWLNSASSIRFPTVFNGDERKVEITGEVYFEVAKKFKVEGSEFKEQHSERVPFIVMTAEQEVEVLGTHFNINAYADEGETKTTLLEGSVRVTPGRNSVTASKLLVPGQESIVRSGDHATSVRQADIEKAVAWKNGYFKFDREDIQSLMRQVSRWYDVDVEYRGEIPSDEFVGKIKRTAYVSGVLRILELSNVKCRVEGRKIIIGN
ncbi:FecR family protein [Arcticibacter tournemirensis]|uniref:DUF4974 domain-containing protein n=1 Tax=Arcticibacter tournemirensis TaxID=699437 RepID=A0A5M9H815_9SPHI|nr:FecR family protein [Arcticibacter tournemirensis]KAA8483082.1 DUF4974 domain-containing protein [Arcticibacter tournemirensis]TQM52005.1 FecR family protein [Arcticibacter tournemirensis]